jgi:hypothetical protein
MMNSVNTEKILNEILQLLDEDTIKRHIEEPIQNAASKFILEKKTPLTFYQFIQTIGKFIQHIYGTGFPIPIKLTDTQAKTEALVLLEEGYQTPYAHGFCAAYLDTLNSEPDGIEYIISQIAELIIHKKKTQYIQWAYCSQIDPKNWQLKNRIAKTIFDQWEKFFPDSLRQCPPEQLSNNIPELINIILSSDQIIRNIYSSNI